MKYSIIILLLILRVDCSYAQDLSSIPSGSLIACGDDKVLIIDPKKGNDSTAIIWTWRVQEAKSKLPERYQKLLIPFDECKAIDNNTKILLTSSGGATCILDVKSRDIEFYAYTPMAHSAALIPGGFVAVANSTHPYGNSLELYHRNASEKILYRDSLYSGHGAVWHAQKEQLFVLGFDEVRCYTVIQNGSDINLQLVYSDKLPDNGGHDLVQVDDHKFLVSTHHHVYLYDISTRKYSIFDQLDAVNVKSINYNIENNHLFYTKAEDSWWTYNIYSNIMDRPIHLPFVKLYKVRVVK